ncbi:mreB/Mbl family protein [Burkholderia pseudomallei MSHR332]|nr:mreB/Mbl family protein [Burkholderia pseudomallei MSHR332]
MRQFVGMSHARSLFGRRVEFTICVPSNATAVEQRAIREAALAAGASRVSLISEPLAAALGAGLPVSEAVGSMVVDIGGGTTEVAVIALGGIVYREAIRVGGDQFDAAIVNHVRNLYGVLLGEHTAEHVKKTIGTASCRVPRESIHAIGRSVADGLPRTIELSNHDIADALAAPLNPGGERGEERARERAARADHRHRGSRPRAHGRRRAAREPRQAASRRDGARPRGSPTIRSPARCAAPARRWGGAGSTQATRTRAISA